MSSRLPYVWDVAEDGFLMTETAATSITAYDAVRPALFLALIPWGRGEAPALRDPAP